MKLIFGFLALLISFSSFAESVSFGDIWKKFYDKSLKQKAAREDVEATQLSEERGDRHWLPRVYITGQWFRTDDPTQVFFNDLGQRSIEQTDFVPSQLNNPGNKNFKAGVLGLDLPLFEGGMKSSQSSMYRTLVKASQLELKAKESEEYAELSRNYGNLLLLSKSGSLLQELRKNLDKIISSYQVGAQSNPVGYSGLLGLKGVGNRIDGMLTQNDLLITNAQSWIGEKIQEPIALDPQEKDLDQFLVSNLSVQPDVLHSTMIRAQEYKLEALEKTQGMERGRYLPRVGLFAQNNIYSGNRDTETSQTVGLYVMWDLFNPDSYGRLAEARAQAIAQSSKLLAGKQEEKIMRNELQSSKIALERTLQILDDSEKLLREQTTQSMRLFRSGMLNALQLSEVINRRVDLIDNKLKAELQYLDIRSRQYQLYH